MKRSSLRFVNVTWMKTLLRWCSMNEEFHLNHSLEITGVLKSKVSYFFFIEKQIYLQLSIHR